MSSTSRQSEHRSKQPTGERAARPESYDVIADLYDVDMGASADPRDFDWYLQRCGAGERPLLELGCGTGRLSLGLVRSGHRLIALDGSAAMLRVLAAKIRALRPQERSRILPVRMDMRDWCSASPMDAVLCPYSAFTYLVEERDRDCLLASLRAALAPGGRLLFDLFVPDPHVESLPYAHVHRDYRRELGDGRMLERTKTIARERKPRVHTIVRRYRIFDADGQLERSFETCDTIRSYRPQEVPAWLEKAGFEIVEQVFDYGHAPAAARPRSVAFECRPRS